MIFFQVKKSEMRKVLAEKNQRHERKSFGNNGFGREDRNSNKNVHENPNKVSLGERVRQRESSASSQPSIDSSPDQSRLRLLSSAPFASPRSDSSNQSGGSDDRRGIKREREDRPPSPRQRRPPSPPGPPPPATPADREFKREPPAEQHHAYPRDRERSGHRDSPRSDGLRHHRDSPTSDGSRHRDSPRSDGSGSRHHDRSRDEHRGRAQSPGRSRDLQRVRSERSSSHLDSPERPREPQHRADRYDDPKNRTRSPAARPSESERREQARERPRESSSSSSSSSRVERSSLLSGTRYERPGSSSSASSTSSSQRMSSQMRRAQEELERARRRAPTPERVSRK